MTWLALAGVLLLLPGPSATVRRVRALRPDPVGSDAGRAVPRGWAVAAAVVGVLAAVVAAAVLAGAVVGLAVTVLGGTGAWLARSGLAAHASSRHERELRAALHLLAAELAVGSAPPQALRAAADLAPFYRAVLLDSADALQRGEVAVFDSEGLRPLAHAWRVAAVTGAALADVVGRVAADVAARAEIRRAVSGAVAGARSSAMLLAVLPVLGLVLGAGMQAHPLTVLFATPYGRLLCLVGVCLDCAGLVWTQRLADRAVRAP